MKALVLVIGLVAGCATHPVAPVSQAGYDYELRQEQAEIDKEAQASAERARLNQIEQQQSQIRQQQQQQREEQQKATSQPSGTPTFSQ